MNATQASWEARKRCSRKNLLTREASYKCSSSWAKHFSTQSLKTQFEKRRARPVQVMNGERLQRQPFIAQI